MIDLKSDGRTAFGALQDHIAAAGHWLAFENNVPVVSDEAAVQAIIDAFSVSDAKAARKAEVSVHAKALRDRVIARFSAGEMASWAIKRAEAAAFAVSADAALAPLLAAEATARGITLSAVVARVQGNAAALGMLEAAIAGNEGRHRDAVDALTTYADIAAYDYTTGWPNV